MNRYIHDIFTKICLHIKKRNCKKLKSYIHTYTLARVHACACPHSLSILVRFQLNIHFFMADLHPYQIYKKTTKWILEKSLDYTDLQIPFAAVCWLRYRWVIKPTAREIVLVFQRGFYFLFANSVMFLLRTRSLIESNADRGWTLIEFHKLKAQHKLIRFSLPMTQVVIWKVILYNIKQCSEKNWYCILKVIYPS